MKIRMFNRGNGWYIPCSNYKDETDKAYLNVHFTQKCGEPVADLNEQGYAQIDVNVIEGKHESYKKQVKSLTVFKYDLLTNADLSNFGGKASQSSQSLDIQPDDLPFY